MTDELFEIVQYLNLSATRSRESGTGAPRRYDAVLLGQYPNLDRFWRTSNFVGIILPELIQAQKHRKWHKRILPNFAI